MVTVAMKLKDACSLDEKGYDQPRQHIQKQGHYFANKGPFSQSCGYPGVMYRHESLDVRVEPQRRQSTNELMLLNCGVGEDS